jgi:SAM-dependent methyltransferase
MRKWENIYSAQKHASVWPWTDLVSLVNKFTMYKYIKNLSFLEIGTGYGANIEFLIKNNNEYYGNEESKSAYQFIKKKYKNKKINIKNDNYLNINYGNLKFDCIIDRASVTHNTYTDVKKIFKKSYNVINPGGNLISTFLFSKKCSAFRVQKKNIRSFNNISSGFLKDLGLVTFFNKEDLLNIIPKQFEIISIEHNQKNIFFPNREIIAWWNIVLKKNGI